MSRFVSLIGFTFLCVFAQAEVGETDSSERFEAVSRACERAGDESMPCDDALIAYKIESVKSAFNQAISAAKSKTEKERLVKSQDKWFSELSSKCPFDASFWGDDEHGVMDARGNQRYCWSRVANQRCMELTGKQCVE